MPSKNCAETEHCTSIVCSLLGKLGALKLNTASGESPAKRRKNMK